jgi:hypothetical protein
MAERPENGTENKVLYDENVRKMPNISLQMCEGPI